MVGDLGDIVARLLAALPGRWFAGTSPNLIGLLNGIGTPWAWLYSRITYVIQQTRLLTATEEWLDLIANDYLGSALQRKPGEPDGAYRVRIQGALLCEAATRSGVSLGLQALTGTKPVIFEPGNCRDTGGYGGVAAESPAGPPGMVYGVAGGWGSLELPFQFFVTVARPASAGKSTVAGYGTTVGGFGQGAISYIDLGLLPGQVTDQDIQNTLHRLMPMNAVAWLRII
ncbi:MAG TPA: hypothetical protein DDZ81_07920 [Acetobacteraceae bacterium]|jgi:hypothetical protein|nr:hypothetical protein [Acetobacteraceae bacterium]